MCRKFLFGTINGNLKFHLSTKVSLSWLLWSYRKDLLSVVDESRRTGKKLVSFHATFVALIPLTYDPSSFEKFMLILLCNCIYKIVAKFIAMRVKS